MTASFAVGDRVRRRDLPGYTPWTGTVAVVVGTARSYYGIQLDHVRPGALWYAGADEIEPLPLPTIGDRVYVSCTPFGERPGTLVEITPDAIVCDAPTLWVVLDLTLDDLAAGIGDEALTEAMPFRAGQVRGWPG